MEESVFCFFSQKGVSIKKMTDEQPLMKRMAYTPFRLNSPFEWEKSQLRLLSQGYEGTFEATAGQPS